MRKIIIFCLLVMVTHCAMGQNPIFKERYTPDPAPFVHGDTVYCFTGHDEDGANYFTMKNWQLFTTTDMKHWEPHGIVLDLSVFKWARQDDNAWAGQCVERNGKWYWYVAVEDTAKHVHGIGVAMADSPYGPYHDSIGRPLVPGNWGFIDPSVFVDNDGQAYLFWGNNGLWYAKLNPDMVTLASDIIKVNTDDEMAFGPKILKHDYATNSKMLKTNFEEAPWVYRRGKLYYLEYAAGGVPEHWAYSTAENINGPWTYRGRILDEPENSFTIHGGSITFKGRHFIFYHNGCAPQGGGFRRSTCVEEFKYKKDGTIPHVSFTKIGVKKPVK